MFDRLPILVLVPHADAGDRAAWTTDQDLRPLTDLGRAQAASLAPAVGRVDAVVTSPARRCVETVEPIAFASEVDIQLDDGFRELSFVTEHEPWDPWQSDPTWRSQLLTAAGLGRFTSALQRLASRGSERRVAIGAHGDLVPLFAMFAAAQLGVPVPEPIARGGAYQIDVSDRSAPIRSLGALAPRPPGPAQNETIRSRMAT